MTEDEIVTCDCACGCELIVDEDEGICLPCMEGDHGQR